MNLLIVESPNKVKSIRQILGDDWEVAATAGHIMDLPRREMGIDFPAFTLRYEYIPERRAKGRTFPGGKARMDRLRPLARRAEGVYLATDPDREGEAIAAHIQRALALPEDRCHRVRFNAIDRATIEKGLREAGKIDRSLVRAQEARRALDRLVGYTVSPLMSRALDERVSAGRVQSPALRYVVERERAIRHFRSTRHFTARLHFESGRWQAEWITRDFLAEGERYILDEAKARQAAAVRDLRVLSRKTHEATQPPPPPFTTSTLLQAASVELGMSPEQSAQTAQRLFEDGHISYHRTDATAYADETLSALRAHLTDNGHPISPEVRRFKSAADAQEAHEPIRPKDFGVTSLEGKTDASMAALYGLIHRRALASQMPDAVDRIDEAILAGAADGERFRFKARTKTPLNAGWRAMSANDKASDSEGAGEANHPLPALTEGQSLRAEHGEVITRDTEPPSRYTKASLIKKLESGGVGRPSTFATIVTTLERRGYIQEKKRKLHATALGERLMGELIRVGFSFADPRFTKRMEDSLDRLAGGEDNYTELLQQHYDRLDEEAAEHGGLAAAQGSAPSPPTDEHGKPYPCPQCGEPLMRRTVKKGDRAGSHFWSCSAWKTTGCKGAMDDQDGVPVAREAPAASTDAEGRTHECPECGSPLVRRAIRNGPRAGSHFWACRAWRETGCKGAMDDRDGVPVPRQPLEPTTDANGQPYPCPDCGAPLIRRTVKKGDRAGSHFWSCSAWRETGCKGSMDDEDGRPVPRRSREARGGFQIIPD